MPEPKKGMLLAIGLGKADKGKADDGDEPPASERGDDEGDEAFNEAADEAFDALKKGDREAFREALYAACCACMEA